jgi:hypothetical protein
VWLEVFAFARLFSSGLLPVWMIFFGTHFRGGLTLFCMFISVRIHIGSARSRESTAQYL